MKKTIIIIICVLVLLGAVAAGLILFLPHNETIHIENPFVKTHIADAEVQGDMPEGTKLDTASADGYTLSRKDNGSTIAALYWHRDDEKNTSIMINSGDCYGSWWYSKD